MESSGIKTFHYVPYFSLNLPTYKYYGRRPLDSHLRSEASCGWDEHLCARNRPLQVRLSDYARVRRCHRAAFMLKKVSSKKNEFGKTLNKQEQTENSRLLPVEGCKT